MIEHDARKFLKRMVKTGGFIAPGIVGSSLRFWRTSGSISTSIPNLQVLAYLQREKLVLRDTCGRLLITEKGRKFARPWFMRIW